MGRNMKFIFYLSDYIIPVTILCIVLFGLLMKVSVYDEFVKGAEEGFRVVLHILPTLIGLMVGIGMLRASGALDYLSAAVAPAAEVLHFPAELVGLAVVRMFSSSAATSLALDIFRQYGPDSYLGWITSIMMSCTETIFYTMSVYFMAAKVTKTRYTLPGALLTTLVGVAASVVLANMM